MRLNLFYTLPARLASCTVCLLCLLSPVIAQNSSPESAVEAAAQPATLQDRPEFASLSVTDQETSVIRSIGANELQLNSGEQDSDASERNAPPGTEPTLNMLGTIINAGESHRLLWVAGQTAYGSNLETPVYVIRGEQPGDTLCLTSAIHGDELNGVEIVRKLVSELSPKQLHGTVIGVPIVNLLGFTQGSRYLPDRRDLNRYFPGNPNGSSASRIAYSFFEDIVRHCDFLIDLHTGSLKKTNMPQVRANLEIPAVVEFTTKFGSTPVLHSRKLRGNLRSEATNEGIPSIALELGEPGSLQEEHVAEGVRIIETVLSGLDMTHQQREASASQPIFYSSRWVRVNSGGLLISKVDVGERVSEGAVLGAMVNPITNESIDVVSPYAGRVLGMALSQFMLPGYAAFNIGIAADKAEVVVDTPALNCNDPDPQLDQPSEESDCTLDEEENIESEDSELGE